MADEKLIPPQFLLSESESEVVHESAGLRGAWCVNAQKVASSVSRAIFII